MRFDPWRCPKCNQPAKGVREMVPGLTRLFFDEEGDGEYDGGVDLCWDGQVPVHDEMGRVTLECCEGHQWQTHPARDESTPSGQTEGQCYDLCIDGAAFRAQRQLLLQLLESSQQPAILPISPEQRELLDGLINLTDAIADQAADRYGIKCLI